jgi:uncharacterized protein YuzE
MKLNYYSETDTLYIEISEKPSTDTIEVAQGVLLDFDIDGCLVGIDIDHASKLFDVSELSRPEELVSAR